MNNLLPLTIMRTDWDCIVLGAGASGCFFAANLPEEFGRNCLILEQGKNPLQKVRISGGGRCNVTHACFEANELVTHYPRGEKELRSVFSRFQPGDTFSWFDERNISLKIEFDNRVFPESDSSQTIIECFLNEIHQNNVSLTLSQKVTGVLPLEEGFSVQTKTHRFFCKKLVVASGGNPASWKLLESLGLEIVSPVPSLFTFNTEDSLLTDMQGISLPNAIARIPELGLEAEGPTLITHWGLSGPAILRLSAWGARELHDMEYAFEIRMNWMGKEEDETRELLEGFIQSHGEKSIGKINPFGLARRFWERICLQSDIPTERKYKQIQHAALDKLVHTLVDYPVAIAGKSTFKEEFVTAGGVDLREIDFRTMRSKKHPNLYVLGEALNIDAITGGFNFQACWSEAWIAAKDYTGGVV